MPALHILIIKTGDRFWAMGEGAGAASFFRSARGYVDHGHRVTVLMTRDLTIGGRPAKELYHGMNLVRVAMPYDPMVKGTGGPLGVVRRLHHYVYYAWTMGRAAHRLARALQPDVIVAFGAHSAGIARRVAKRIGVPNVTRLFGQSLNLYMDSSGKVRDRLRFLVNLPDAVGFRTPCSALICHDDGSRGDMVARYFGVPEDRFHFWRDGVDIPAARDLSRLPRFKAALGLPPDRVVALSLGRLVVEKGLERILAALAQVSDVVPELDVVFVGEGPLRDELERRSRETSVSERVHFIGAVRQDELHEVFGAADFLVSTCDRTNMTNSTLEGMAAAVPPIVLDTGATASVVRHMQTGILVPPGNASALAEGVSRMASDVALREKLGRQARAFVEQEFCSVDERVRREVDLVVSLVTEWNGTGGERAAANAWPRRPSSAAER